MNALEAAFAQPIAHRGLHDVEQGVIENSKSAFVAAIEAGFGIECDIQLTGDDQPVVFHDYVLDRLTAQKGKLTALSFDQLSRIPLGGTADRTMHFSELLTLVDGNAPLIVELKSQGKRNPMIAKAVIKTAQGYKGALVFKSFDAGILYQMRRLGATWPLGIVVKEKDYNPVTWLAAIVSRHLMHYPWTRFEFISCKVIDLKLPMVRFFRAMGKKTMTWTIKSKAEVELARLGADQIVFEADAVKELQKRPM
ncbi:glycerophosphodiester phosphodiesterase family protein [Maritalea sp.]|uniref:glycerophosphodiester phosphodiesterase family protein n=1 Tax=Maritalea sp. TaxID=2003361 RepID=UPI003EF42E30